jgi:hypothetical protein
MGSRDDRPSPLGFVFAFGLFVGFVSAAVFAERGLLIPCKPATTTGATP